MRFGTNHLDGQGNQFSFPDFFEDQMGGRLNDAQRAVFNRVRNDGETPFVKAGELAQNFPRHHQAMMEHLDANKNEIFDRMVRRNGNSAFGEAYDSYDPSNISRMLHRNVGEDFDEMSIRDVSDEKVKAMIDKMKWHGKGTHTYLAPEKTDDWNQRMLDITPWDYEASKWANNPSSTEFDEPERNWGARPGFMKATMGMDDKSMDQHFPKIWSGERRKGSSDNYIGDFNLNNTNEESELMDFSKLHLSEGDPLGAEQRAAENAAMSGEKQKLPVRVSKQKAGMASKTGQTTKSDVVYANEQHFKALRDKVQLFKAHESAKYDWRETLNEGKPSKENPEDEGMHPYVSIMPHKDSKEKEVKKKYDDQKKVQDALAKAAGMVGEGETSPSATRNHTNLNEDPMDFESALDKLISEDWKSDLKASNEYFKKRKERSPEEVAAEKKKEDAQKAKNFAANRNNNVGQMDHSKRND